MRSIICYAHIRKENRESLVERGAPSGNFSMLFLSLAAPGGYFFCGDAVDARRGKAPICLDAVFPMRAVAAR